MIFHFKADAQLEADNIDEALSAIANHFISLSDDTADYGSIFLPDSHLSIKPLPQ